MCNWNEVSQLKDVLTAPPNCFTQRAIEVKRLLKWQPLLNALQENVVSRSEIYSYYHNAQQITTVKNEMAHGDNSSNYKEHTHLSLTLLEFASATMLLQQCIDHNCNKQK